MGRKKHGRFHSRKTAFFCCKTAFFLSKWTLPRTRSAQGRELKRQEGTQRPPRGASLGAPRFLQGGRAKRGLPPPTSGRKKKNTPRLHTAAPRWLSDSLPPAPAVTRKAGEQTPLAAPATRGGRERGRPPRSPGAVPEPRSPKTPSRSQSWSRSRFQPAPPGPTRPQHGGSPRPGSSRPGVGGGAGSERRRHGAVAQCCPQRAPWGLGPAFGVVVLLLDGSCSVVVAGSDKWALSCAS